MKTESSIPHYRRLYEILRKQIVEGVFKEGDLLPSENDLCNQYNLTRPTVRHALDALLNTGMIRKHKGKGSIVNLLPSGIGILSISGTTSALGMHHLETKILSKPQIIPWPEEFIFPLSDEYKNSGCIFLERLRFVNNIAIFYDLNYLPNINLPRFCARKFENQSLFDILRKAYQIEIKGGEQRIRAIQSNEKMSKYFSVEVGHPILHLQRKLETNRPGFYFYSSIFCDTDEHALYGTF